MAELLKDIRNVITNIKLVLFIVIYKLNLKYKHADLFFVTEQTPNPNSSVSFLIKKINLATQLLKLIGN